jgi:hypothetical protein
MPIGDLLDKAKESAKSAADTTATWIDSGKGKIQAGVAAAVEETYKLIDILRSSGFKLGDMVFTFAATPKIKVKIEDAGKGRKNLEKLAESEDSELSRIQSTVINALLAAYILTEKLSGEGYTINQFDLFLTIPPQVTVYLNKD